MGAFFIAIQPDDEFLTAEFTFAIMCKLMLYLWTRVPLET
jgi:hypothetical protein